MPLGGHFYTAANKVPSMIEWMAMVKGLLNRKSVVDTADMKIPHKNCL